MSQISETEQALDELKGAVDKFTASMKKTLALIQPEEAPNTEPQEQPKKKAPAKQKTLTLEDVRKVCTEKTRAGFTAEIKELLIKHGAERLSDIEATEYPALIADVEALADDN